MDTEDAFLFFMLGQKGLLLQDSGLLLGVSVYGCFSVLASEARLKLLTKSFPLESDAKVEICFLQVFS